MWPIATVTGPVGSAYPVTRQWRLVQGARPVGLTAGGSSNSKTTSESADHEAVTGRM